MSWGDWEPVIGLEIHAQLNTNSKLFSSDPVHFGGGDNRFIHPVTLALPGTLPVLNRKAVEYAIKIGLALNSKISPHSVFARKNYFYPDLPKGYQISQYEDPICQGGRVDYYLEGEMKSVRLHRAHLEEDAGKSQHYGDHSLINLNRAGVPLLEIVTEPDLRSPSEAAAYARAVRTILLYLEVSDGNMEEGSMRCDCNLSIRKKGENKLNTKVELKNINSFRFIEKAIEYEIHRHIDLVESGQNILQETRLYDSAKNKTFSMRSKEEAQDYRYFPDPDLLPLKIEESWIEKIRSSLPELPLAKARRFARQYILSEEDCFWLAQDRDLADYFEQVATKSGAPRSAHHWVRGELMRHLNDASLGITECPIKSSDLAELVSLVESGFISGKMAKQVFQEMFVRKKPPKQIVSDLGLEQITDKTEILNIIQQVISSHPQLVDEYREGKFKVFGYFVGQVMRLTKGQAEPGIVNQMLKKELEKK